MTTAISVVNLTKQFPRTSGYADLLPFRKRQWVTAVDNVSLNIEEGELFGLLGPNGAGKTTLVRMLCSLVLPNSGKASIFGHDTLKEDQAVRELVGLVSAEERSFFWRLNGRENLNFYASLYHLPREQCKKRIDELLALVGLEKEGDIRFQNYSTGMRQKLAIARGLLSEPKVLFVDEPTRSLDPVSAQAIRAFLKERVTGGGKTVVLATHNLNEAEQLCGRLAIMSHGQVKAMGTVGQLRSLFQVQEKCELQLKHFSDALLPELQHIDGVFGCRIASRQNGTVNLELAMSDRAAALPRVLATIVGSGVEVSNCQMNQMPLEEIFVQTLGSGGMEGKR